MIYPRYSNIAPHQPSRSPPLIGQHRRTSQAQILPSHSSQPLNRPHQHIQPPFLNCPTLPLRLQHPSNIALHPQRHPRPPSHNLQTLPQSRRMLPRPRRLLRPLNHLGRNTAHSRTMHAETPLRHPFLEFIKKRNPPRPLVDMNPHPPIGHLRML